MEIDGNCTIIQGISANLNWRMEFIYDFGKKIEVRGRVRANIKITHLEG